MTEVLEHVTAPASEPGIFKVVVAVDVQNCFMYSNKDNKNGRTFLNLGTDDKNEGDKGAASRDVANEIARLIEKQKPDLSVFTRDFHPINHISFAGLEGRELNPPVT